MRVVLAVDGSFHSMYAVDAIAQRSWGDNVRLRVLTAVPALSLALPDAFGIGLAPPLMPPEHTQAALRNAERLVHRAAEVLRGRGFVVEPVVREGDPRTVILDEADAFDADLIVLGSQGLTGVKRLFLGSVAAYVASHARCSVEIVRKKGDPTPD